MTDEVHRLRPLRSIDRELSEHEQEIVDCLSGMIDVVVAGGIVAAHVVVMHEKGRWVGKHMFRDREDDLAAVAMAGAISIELASMAKALTERPGDGLEDPPHAG